YADPLDYEALFEKRSTSRKNFLVDVNGERGQMEPMIVQVLQHEFMHQLSEGLARESQVDALARIDEDTRNYMSDVRTSRGGHALLYGTVPIGVVRSIIEENIRAGRAYRIWKKSRVRPLAGDAPIKDHLLQENLIKQAITGLAHRTRGVMESVDIVVIEGTS